MFIINSYLFAQPITFQKTYGGTGIDQGYFIRQTFDSGYIITGSTQSYGAGGLFDDVYLIRIDENGDTLWTKTYGGEVYSYGYSVEQTSDSGFVITGSTNSFGNGGYDVYLIRTDKDGDTLWTKTYGGTLDDEGFSVRQTADEGFIITGWTLNFGALNHDVYLIKTNANGNLLWTKTFGGSGDDAGKTVQQTNDGGYMVAGYNSAHFYLIKTNENGDTLWTKAYIGQPYSNYAYSAQQTSDDGYIIAGITHSGSNLNSYLVKTDGSGNLQWSKLYSGASNDYATSVQQTSDDGYIIGGWSQSFPLGTYHGTLIKTDVNGDTLWTKTFPGGGTSNGYSVQQTVDGGFIFLGNTSVFGAGDYDLILVKTDSNGNSGCNEGFTSAVVSTPGTSVWTPSILISSGGTSTNPATVVSSGCIVTTLCTTVGVNEDEGSLNIPQKFNLEQNYPNPFNPSTTIKFSIPNEEFVSLKVFNSLGEEVAELLNEEKLAGNYSVSFDASQLSSGVYFYKISAGSFTEIKKMILIK